MSYRYHLWEDLGDDLPKLLGARLGQARDPLRQLPVVLTDKLVNFSSQHAGSNFVNIWLIADSLLRILFDGLNIKLLLGIWLGYLCRTQKSSPAALPVRTRICVGRPRAPGSHSRGNDIWALKDVLLDDLWNLLFACFLSLELLLLRFYFFRQGIARPLWEVSQRLGMPPVLGTEQIYAIRYHLLRMTQMISLNIAQSIIS